MNGIDRIGQRVVCVLRIVAYLEDDQGIEVDVPIKHREYTVAGFMSGPTLVSGRPQHGPGITLREVETPECSCCWRPMGWPIQAFRAVNERKTDIGDLVRLGQDARESEDA